MPSFVILHDKPLGSIVAAGLNSAMDLVALASADGGVSVSVRLRPTLSIVELPSPPPFSSLVLYSAALVGVAAHPREFRRRG